MVYCKLSFTVYYSTLSVLYNELCTCWRALWVLSGRGAWLCAAWGAVRGLLAGLWVLAGVCGPGVFCVGCLVVFSAQVIFCFSLFTFHCFSLFLAGIVAGTRFGGAWVGFWQGSWGFGSREVSFEKFRQKARENWISAGFALDKSL
ncbi:Hypothetical_protein [Hexamita inflata]|uniref:Hypothetical_protein n=1 Tax=Hexamita inflata TaxID=28002 RepID=A0AA86P9R5_9EUKA|nr:Hypothetical protein HINF_LOCUS21248 [Hexamita inflata]